MNDSLGVRDGEAARYLERDIRRHLDRQRPAFQASAKTVAADIFRDDERSAAVFADVELQQKDLVLAQELARRLGVAVPTCAATSEMLNAARASRQADRDFLVSVHEAYRRMGGME